MAAIKKLTALFVVGMLLLPASFTVNTATAPASLFDPNFLLSDEELQSWKAMTKGEIQAFLDDHGGYIAQLKTEDKDGVRRSAAEIISRAAAEHRINPKYLLVKLQKEQSLVTEKDPTQKQLDGATGYGITDSCGWDCETYKKNQGFGKQVDAAAAIMRWYYDNAYDKTWIKKPLEHYLIDGVVVRPVNLATAFLYTYTPHLQGNENFWRLWQRWFEQQYPSGTLVKTKSVPDIYLIQDGTKRKIMSMSVLTTRFDPNLIITIPESELARYEEGPELRFPNFSLVRAADTTYLVDYDRIRPFASQDVVRTLGYHPDEIIEAEAEDLKGYEAGPAITSDAQYPFGRLVRAKETDALYYIKDGVLRPVYEMVIARANFPGMTAHTVPLSELEGLTDGSFLSFPNGTIIGVTGFNEIYVVENGKKRHITSETVFTGLGYDWKNILWVNTLTGIAHTTGQPLYLRHASQVAAPASEAPSESEENEDVQTQEPKTSAILEEGKFFAVPQADTVYTGPKFETNINTYLVADAATGDILSGKNIDVVRPTASFAKVLTAYELFEQNLNTRRAVIYDPAKHRAQYHRFRIAPGEAVRNPNLLDAFLVSSLNTPGRMLVSSVTNDEASFIASLNAQAKEWNLSNTVFADVTGESLKTKTTAREYLTIFLKGTSHPSVREYLEKSSYRYTELADTDGYPDHSDTHSNKLVGQTLPFRIIASKTGYLDEAGAGLAMLVERATDKKQFVIITMGNPDYTRRFTDPKALAVWALGQF